MLHKTVSLIAVNMIYSWIETSRDLVRIYKTAWELIPVIDDLSGHCVESQVLAQLPVMR